MFRSTSQFDKLLEKATSNLLLEPDWNLILQLCDCVRQGDVQPKYAIGAIKKKFYNANPNVVLFALQVMESCVKNCGSTVHTEIATKTFMEEMKELAKNSTNENVKNKILELIQTWAHAFRNDPNYRAVQDTLNVMKVEGYTFPVLKESDAMFVADQAPEWVEGECCHRCRVQFGVVNRKHHCRNCGQIFCSKCSSKSSSIPKFGIEKEVRVCETCYDALTKPLAASKTADANLPAEYLGSSLALQSQAPPNKTEQELREEEELQLALALSQSEAENKGKDVNVIRAPSPPTLENNIEMDPELSRYLNRSYWEQKQQQDENKMMATTVPTAPVSSTTSTNTAFSSVKIIESYQNGIADELDEFVNALRSSLEIFVNRMKSNSSRGRSISNDTAVQSLFLNITTMHAQLLRFIQEQEDGRVYYEGLQDKLNQIKDARAALDALREDHRDRLRREAEEAERLRQIQMAQKLELMRKKKQEYLEYQRQMALQRMQEQEREMHLRQEQQKHQYILTNPAGMYVAPQQRSFVPPQPQNFNPSGSNSGSPVHTPYSPHHPSFQAPIYQQPEYSPYNMQGMPGAIPAVIPQNIPFGLRMAGPNNQPQQVHPSNVPGGGNAPHPVMPSNSSMSQISGSSMPTLPPNQSQTNIPAVESSSQSLPTTQPPSNEAELISFD